MSELLIRIMIVAVVGVMTWLLVWSGRHFVALKRRQVLEAMPTAPQREMNDTPTRVRILAFSSDDCRQCHQLQEPALRLLLEKRGEVVTVEHIDAPTEPELTRQYQVLTVPTTVVLDAAGKAHSINYGFANVQRLLEQVDAALE